MANQIDLSRKPRSTETREAEVRQTSWKPAHDLPSPAPQDGYKFRWIRAAMMGQSDPANMARARREGWVPCKASDHPEISSDFAAFGLTPASDLIEIGGLVLCKTTQETADARREYYEDMTQRQTQSVDNNLMRESDPRMPLFREGKSKVSFGNGA
jgi:hypothetical protein